MKYEIKAFSGRLLRPFEPSKSFYLPELDAPMKKTDIFFPPYTNSSKLLINDLSRIWSVDRLMGNDLQSDVNTSLIIFPWLSKIDSELLLNRID